MSEENQKSSAAPRSFVIRFVLIGLFALVILLAGHYAFRVLSGRGNSPAGVGEIKFGGAAGRDAADVPPPPLSERAFSSASPGAPDRFMAGYTSRAGEDEVVRFYRREMQRRGWTERRAPAGIDAGYTGELLLYSNAAGNSCIIAISKDPNGATAVTILRRPTQRGTDR